MSQRIRYVGLDVSKETIAVAEPAGSVVEYGDIANKPGAVRRSVVEYGEIANKPGAVRRLVDTLSRDAVVRCTMENQVSTWFIQLAAAVARTARLEISTRSGTSKAWTCRT